MMMVLRTGRDRKMVWKCVQEMAQDDPQFTKVPSEQALKWDTLQFKFRGVWVDLKGVHTDKHADRAFLSSQCLKHALESKSQGYRDIILAFKLILHHKKCTHWHGKRRGSTPKAIIMTFWAIAKLDDIIRMAGGRETTSMDSSNTVFRLLDQLIEQLAIFDWRGQLVHVSTKGVCTVQSRCEVPHETENPCVVIVEAQKTDVSDGNGACYVTEHMLLEIKRTMTELNHPSKEMLKNALDAQMLDDRSQRLQQYEDGAAPPLAVSRDGKSSSLRSGTDGMRTPEGETPYTTPRGASTPPNAECLQRTPDPRDSEQDLIPRSSTEYTCVHPPPRPPAAPLSPPFYAGTMNPASKPPPPHSSHHTSHTPSSNSHQPYQSQSQTLPKLRSPPPTAPPCRVQPASSSDQPCRSQASSSSVPSSAVDTKPHPSFITWAKDGNQLFAPGVYKVDDDTDTIDVEVMVAQGANRLTSKILVFIPGTNGFQSPSGRGRPLAPVPCVEVRFHCGGRSAQQGKSQPSWMRPLSMAKCVTMALDTVREWADASNAEHVATDLDCRRRRHVGVFAFSRGAAWVLHQLVYDSWVFDFAWVIAGHHHHHQRQHQHQQQQQQQQQPQ